MPTLTYDLLTSNKIGWPGVARTIHLPALLKICPMVVVLECWHTQIHAHLRIERINALAWVITHSKSINQSINQSLDQSMDWFTSLNNSHSTHCIKQWCRWERLNGWKWHYSRFHHKSTINKHVNDGNQSCARAGLNGPNWSQATFTVETFKHSSSPNNLPVSYDIQFIPCRTLHSGDW